MPTYHLTHAEIRDQLDRLRDDTTERVVSIDSDRTGGYTLVTELVVPMSVKATTARKGYSGDRA